MFYEISDGSLLIVVAGVIALAWNCYRQDSVFMDAKNWHPAFWERPDPCQLYLERGNHEFVLTLILFLTANEPSKFVNHRLAKRLERKCQSCGSLNVARFHYMVHLRWLSFWTWTSSLCEKCYVSREDKLPKIKKFSLWSFLWRLFVYRKQLKRDRDGVLRLNLSRLSTGQVLRTTRSSLGEYFIRLIKSGSKSNCARPSACSVIPKIT